MAGEAGLDLEHRVNPVAYVRWAQLWRWRPKFFCIAKRDELCEVDSTRRNDFPTYFGELFPQRLFPSPSPMLRTLLIL